YHKTAGLQEYHAASFGLGQDMCNKWIHVLTPLLEKAVSQWRPGQGNQQLSEGQECHSRQVNIFRMMKGDF
ncbi:MAG: hypothetical protein HRU12_10900, partial [Phaeodactylibacter sp.]|nr:hypothetical protein [Phaeodactylibacter sp.]